MSVGAYVFGLAWLVAVVAISLFAAIRARRWLCPGWSGPPAWTVDSVLAVALLVLVGEAVGLVGWFSRPGIMVGVLVAAGAVIVLASTSHPASPAPPPAPGSGGPLLALALTAAFVTAVIWAEPVLHSLEVGMYRQDSTWYHLSFSAHFFQTGDTGTLLFTDPLRLAPWFYPQNSELLHAVGMVGFGRDFLSPLVNLGWMALALVAAWCVGRPFGQGPLTLLAVAVVLAADMMQVQAGNAPSDMPALFFLLAAIAILVNAGAASRRFPRLAAGPVFAAAVAVGLAVGTKVTLLIAAGVLTLGLALLVPREARRKLVGVWIAGILLAGGFWYARNLAHAGNPFPWIGFGFLPTPDQPSVYPRPPHSIAGYLGDPGVWVEWFAPALAKSLGVLWPVPLIGAAVGLIVGLWQREDQLLRTLAIAALFTVLAYLLIPIGAPGTDGEPYGFGSNLRYVAPALLIGLLTIVLLGLRRGIPQVWIAGCLTLVFVGVVLSSDSWGLGEMPGALILASVIVAAPYGLIRAARRGTSSVKLGVGVAAIVALTASVGYAEQRVYAEQRYLAALIPPADNPGFRSEEEWAPIQDWARRQHDERIGLVGPAGAFGQYIFYGGDLSNNVRYIGAPGPHGAFQPIDNCLQWRAAVNAGNYDYLVITPPLSVGPTASSLEDVWTRGDPAAKEVFHSEPASIYRMLGQLDPDRCMTLPGSNLLFPWTGQGVLGAPFGQQWRDSLR